MEPYQKQLMEKLVSLSEENNKILKGLRRNSRWAAFFSFIKWAIILVPLVWAYFYFQPYLGNVKTILEKLPQQLQAIEGVNNQLNTQIESAKDFLKNPPKIPL